MGVVASLAALGVFSAFSSQTDNPDNEVEAGTVVLADNDAGSAAYNIENAKPGDTDQACIPRRRRLPGEGDVGFEPARQRSGRHDRRAHHPLGGQNQ